MLLVDIVRLEIEIVELKPSCRECGNQDMKARRNCITGYIEGNQPIIYVKLLPRNLI